MLLQNLLHYANAFGLSLSSVQNALMAPAFPQDEWDSLKEQVEGRLFQTKPFAYPCFSGSVSSPECDLVRSDYKTMRTQYPSAYTQTQWETCQATSEGCLIDPTSPSSISSTAKHCSQGSVPQYFIDVSSPKDIAAAFNFSKTTKTPLVIKNTGHDYNGRSSAPGSLALWTHNLKNMSFDPEFLSEGCSRSQRKPAMTVGAGVQWGEAYKFADAHNITIVGGADQNVGVVGGWLQGGGHGSLSNVMGMGVDRVLQFSVVTPDGQYRIANECQNEDLFFALRGGGGGTFGVVMDASILASPRITLQAVFLKFSPNVSVTEEMWSIMAANGLKWANDGWGGYSMAQVLILVNPKLTKQEAQESLADLLDFGERLERNGVAGFQMTVTELPSWYDFFEMFVEGNVATTGTSLALASRLVSKSNFATPQRRAELVSGLLAADAATPGLIILMTTPASTPSSGMTSVNEAWRSSLYHVTVISPWNWNATKEEQTSHYEKASASIDNLRNITPDAAYFNEADVYEPSYKVAFWGTHYPELLRIKRKYDPDHLLDCWHCVGWNPQSERFSCYL
ncbi:FAD-binding domain-containing protein [Pholiota conissans]|uniref:FAD-binding domain-containing protein n=1 Tax=Pholiota conissans TaxID=109636 RepID=A0A9P5Z8I0_9AGAR|nr:FAD-binding domain-containing protein [Pholiota conissans]